MIREDRHWCRQRVSERLQYLITVVELCGTGFGTFFEAVYVEYVRSDSLQNAAVVVELRSRFCVAN